MLWLIMTVVCIAAGEPGLASLALFFWFID
jgi:hypothetical protein